MTWRGSGGKRPRWAGALAVLASVLLVAGCGADREEPAADHHSRTAAQDGADRADGAGGALPSGHVHAVARNPVDGHVLLATHDGLFRLAPGSSPTRVGPVIDLMGFTVVGPDHFYASGHPGPGTDMPDPVGLIETTDGGRTWTALSRQGRSDFHTLTASTAGVIGYDGKELAMSADGRTWQVLTPPVTPFAVAASPDGRTKLITSEQGLARSTDRGRTWARINTPALLQLVDFTDATAVVAAAPDGSILTSGDAGATWRRVGGIGGAPHALGAQRTSAGSEILAVTQAGLLRSTDDGATFAPYRP
jgi:hypothetical protein